VKSEGRVSVQIDLLCQCVLLAILGPFIQSNSRVQHKSSSEAPRKSNNSTNPMVFDVEYSQDFGRISPELAYPTGELPPSSTPEAAPKCPMTGFILKPQSRLRIFNSSNKMSTIRLQDSSARWPTCYSTFFLWACRRGTRGSQMQTDPASSIDLSFARVSVFYEQRRAGTLKHFTPLQEPVVLYVCQSSQAESDKKAWIQKRQS